MKLAPTPELWRVVCLQIYNQYRILHLKGRAPMVDVLTTLPYADLFHQMLEAATVKAQGPPVRCEAFHMEMFTMDCRRYALSSPVMPDCEVNVLIARQSPNWEHIFAIPDWGSSTYFDLLTNERRPVRSRQAGSTAQPGESPSAATGAGETSPPAASDATGPDPATPSES